MLTVASWNMSRSPASWPHLDALRRRHGIDLFLLQEAARPSTTPTGLTLEPELNERARWRVPPQRAYCSAIAAVAGGPALRARRPVALSDATADWGEFVASHPGQFAVADVTTQGGDVVTVVSLYGIWDKIPERGELFADTTLHRAISDLAVLFERHHDDKVLVAGDLNVWHAYEGAGERWARRCATVFARFAAHGLELLGPFRPDGSLPLVGCPCQTADCRHVNTFRYQRRLSSAPYQNDYVFATPFLARQLADGGCYACDDDDVWDFSDHRPVVVRFDLEE